LSHREDPSPPRPRRAVLTWAQRVTGAALALCAIVPRATKGAPPAGEYDVKAAFLYNVAKFVEWPPEAFASPEDPIVIGIAGVDPFGPDLDRAVAGRTANGRGFLVRRFRRPEELRSFCHILFVGAAEDARRWLTAVRDFQGTGALTVGEGVDFARQGSIAFVIENRRVRILVNLEAAEEARLRVSVRLLAVARRVDGAGEEGAH